jgi:hypothetical protein
MLASPGGPLCAHGGSDGPTCSNRVSPTAADPPANRPPLLSARGSLLGFGGVDATLAPVTVR